MPVTACHLSSASAAATANGSTVADFTLPLRPPLQIPATAQPTAYLSSLLFPNDRRARIWAAHDFPGHSWFNPTHGNKRASLRDQSHLYICGHRHNWALHCEENADTNEVYWFARARGYKYIDHHGENLGHEAQMEGACIVSVIDPDSVSESGFVQCFSDPHAAADFLTYKRRKAAA